MKVFLLKQAVISILVTLNSNYVKRLIVMLTSLIQSNPGTRFAIYIAYTSLTEPDFAFINQYIGSLYCSIKRVKIPSELLRDAPITRNYPKEMYYRIFAAQFLPEELERVLYLDPDLLVINSLDKLYSTNFQGNLFAAASHTYESLEKLNRIRLKMPENCKYVNSGVMMMNLALLREQQNIEEVFKYIREYKNRLIFPDQDVINGLYGDRIIPIDPKIYNLSDRYYLFYNLHPKNKEHKIDIEWVRRNTVVIHYCGKNKPWKENYRGKLGTFYRRFEQFIFENGDCEKELAERFPAYRP